MKTIITILSSAAVALALFAGFGTQVEAGGCYSIRAEAQAMESHFRHIVYVENDCDYWLQCSVWTNVDPQPPTMLSVGPGMTENAETNGRSSDPDPRAFGECRRK
ncbi:MAG: hypothetical protein OEN21_12185 [Myxococcales bacterium]|nr:hypothetical protein [Myxococcales bacterium]